MQTPKVSIIVPVYNVEKFLSKCVKSLMEQNLDDIEYVFVDDCSTDSSMSLLETLLRQYPERRRYVKIVHHSENKGLAAARNSGLDVATGEYIYHCDSDDWVERHLAEKLYCAAVLNDADVAYCDFYISFEQNERYMHCKGYKSTYDMLKNGFLSGAMKYNVWNKLVRRKVYAENEIRFPEGHNMGEDMTMIQVVACASGLVYVPEGLYHYVKLNTNAYSNAVSEKSLSDIQFNMDRTVSFLKKKYGSELDSDIISFKLSNKLPFLISSSVSDYQRWQSWYPETRQYVFSDSRISLRFRILQLAASMNQFWVLKLHYWFLHKLVYGIIFK